VVLIFDEISFRLSVGYRCAQTPGVIPDMCAAGNASRRFRCLVVCRFDRRRPPSRLAVHVGTFNAHGWQYWPRRLPRRDRRRTWSRLETNERFFYGELRQLFSAAGITVRVKLRRPLQPLLGSMRSQAYRDVSMCGSRPEAAFTCACLERGVYFHYARHHGSAPTQDDFEEALVRIEDAARAVRPGQVPRLLAGPRSAAWATTSLSTGERWRCHFAHVNLATVASRAGCSSAASGRAIGGGVSGRTPDAPMLNELLVQIDGIC
jgi:hypothetical protein